MINFTMRKNFNIIFVLLLITFCITLIPRRVDADVKILRMATTTSTDNTGVLDYLSGYLYRDTGINLIWISVGTGKALMLGKNCDVDVLFVHAPKAEKKFADEGYGIDRKRVMYNDFVIVGPPEDPAGIRGKSLDKALKGISFGKAKFISRGDESGTHKKEKYLWKKIIGKIPEKEGWYLQTGQGMLQTLIMATELKGYTLTDRGTFIKYQTLKDVGEPLIIMVEGDRELINQYSVMAVNPAVCKNAKYKNALEFINWITSERAQKLIGDFRLMGKKLFIPNAESQ